MAKEKYFEETTNITSEMEYYLKRKNRYYFRNKEERLVISTNENSNWVNDFIRGKKYNITIN